MPKDSPDQIDLLDGMVAPPKKVVEAAQQAWNDFAVRYKWRESKVLDKALRASIERAVGDYGGLTGWRDALAKIAKNRFVQGQVAPTGGHKQFKANIVWFCRAQTIRNVIEDAYDDDGADAGDGKVSLSKMMAPSDPWAVWLRDYKPRGFWPAHLGPRPEEPNCRAPAPMVAAWRERVGFKAPPVVQETAEDRLAHLVVSYRQRGFYDKGNSAEEELAKLQGRPPVLVPGPDVAGLTGAGSDRRAAPPASRINPAFVDVSPEPPDYADIPEGQDFGGSE